jgi:hypothetical protein
MCAHAREALSAAQFSAIERVYCASTVLQRTAPNHIRFVVVVGVVGTHIMNAHDVV